MWPAYVSKLPRSFGGDKQCSSTSQSANNPLQTHHHPHLSCPFQNLLLQSEEWSASQWLVVLRHAWNPSLWSQSPQKARAGSHLDGDNPVFFVPAACDEWVSAWWVEHRLLTSSPATSRTLIPQLLLAAIGCMAVVEEGACRFIYTN